MLVPKIQIRNFAIILILAILTSLVAGFLIGYFTLPPYLITITAGLMVMAFLIARPREGVYLFLFALYFPLFPNVPIGSLEFTFTTFLLVGILLGVLNLKRKDKSVQLARWQLVLLLALGIAFLFSVIFSDSITTSIKSLPNLIIYLIILYVFMVLFRTTKQLWSIARLILVLAFILSFWRTELRPLRLLLGLSSLGINAAVFDFHPAVAIALVICVLFTKNEVSIFWKIFSWLVLFSLIYHGFSYQTRAGWLAWIIMAVFLVIYIRGRARIIFTVAVSCIVIIGLLFFSDLIKNNVSQTQATILAANGDTSYANVNNDDVVRLIARDAGLQMFYARPIFGWGPNSYIRLKPLFVEINGKAGQVQGAFNAWLLALDEWGIVGTFVTLIVFLGPVFIIWFIFRKKRNTTTYLALAFTMGILGLSIHLLFIDLLFSFTWVHAGLALAAVRMAQDNVKS
jgi:hypothetical protein